MNVFVAGAGHGGLVAAGLLAKAGLDVTVFERAPEENLGHDWTDIFRLSSFREAGIPLPGPEEYTIACGMTFHNSKHTLAVDASVPREQSQEAQMERRDILRHLIRFAREGGAKLVFQAEVEGPVIAHNRVAGLRVDGKTLCCDLVIDAAGMHSPVRRQLPDTFGITKGFSRDQFFTIFRAFYNATGAPPPEHQWNVYLLPMGRKGVAWIVNEGAYVDLLCGAFEDIDAPWAEEIRRHYLPHHPDMGDEIVRGGQVASIPVRRPISKMVADGYAAIGDAAAMTVPINGSGLTHSIQAGRILAETVLASGSSAAEALWPYQVQFMQSSGAALASLDVLKRFIMTVKPSVVDVLLERNILTAADLNKARTGQEVTFPLSGLAIRGLRGIAHLPTMLRLMLKYIASRRLKRHALGIPPRYDEAALQAWAKKYDAM